MLSIVDRYREWFEQEIDSNDKMLGMIESVPADKRSDRRFQRAATLAAHLCACRENWLDRMTNGTKNQGPWWEEDAKLETLRPRYVAMEKAWCHYLAKIDDKELARNFEFPASQGSQSRWNIEGQIMQLIGHAFYHRGQIALLVDQLGGETVDTDYLYWAFPRNPEWGLVTDP